MRHHIVYAVALISLAFSSQAFAQPAHEDITGRWGAGMIVAGAMPADDSESATYIGGNFTYGVMDYFAVGLEVGGMKFDRDPGRFDFGDLTGAPVLGIMQLRYPFAAGKTKATIYGTLGLGAIFWHYEESDVLQAALVDVEVEDAFAVKLGLGFDLLIDKNWAVNLEGAYVFSDSETTVRAPALTPIVDTVDTDYWTIGGGFKYFI